ncbi:MAG TPA: hypothetical protein QGH10_14855 [Armatimonadota bacterium]|nr:hypothetical protein [Armatimonadota bacterium]
MSRDRLGTVIAVIMAVAIVGLVAYAYAQDGEEVAQGRPPAAPGMMPGQPPMGGPGMMGGPRGMMGGPPGGGPTMQVADGSVYVMAGPKIYRLDGKTLEQKAEWEIPRPERPEHPRPE